MLSYRAVVIQIVLYKAYHIYVSGYTRNCDMNTIMNMHANTPNHGNTDLKAILLYVPIYSVCIYICI